MLGVIPVIDYAVPSQLELHIAHLADNIVEVEASVGQDLLEVELVAPDHAPVKVDVICECRSQDLIDLIPLTGLAVPTVYGKELLHLDEDPHQYRVAMLQDRQSWECS